MAGGSRRHPYIRDPYAPRWCEACVYRNGYDCTLHGHAIRSPNDTCRRFADTIDDDTTMQRKAWAYDAVLARMEARGQ